MAANCSVLTHPRPFGVPTHPDFDICDRRYGMNLDIPRCDVAANRLDVGSASTIYRISDQAGPGTLPQIINYGWWCFQKKNINRSPKMLTIWFGRRLYDLRRSGRSTTVPNIHPRAQSSAFISVTHNQRMRRAGWKSWGFRNTGYWATD